MTILEKENYRLHTITKFDKGPSESAFIDLSISEGVGIEKRCENSDSYYVICFVKYNKKECSAEIEDVGIRLLDVEVEEFKLYKELLKTAKQLVETANMEVE